MSERMVEAAASTAQSLFAALPAQFLVLLLINVVFIGGLLWFVHDIDITRTEAVKQIVLSCSEGLAHSTPVPK